MLWRFLMLSSQLIVLFDMPVDQIAVERSALIGGYHALLEIGEKPFLPHRIYKRDLPLRWGKSLCIPFRSLMR